MDNDEVLNKAAPGLAKFFIDEQNCGKEEDKKVEYFVRDKVTGLTNMLAL